MHFVAAIPLLAMRTFFMARSPPRDSTYSSMEVVVWSMSVVDIGWEVVVDSGWGGFRNVEVGGLGAAGRVPAPLERNAVFTFEVKPVVTAMTVAR